MLEKIENAREKLLARGKIILVEEGYAGLAISRLTAECGMAAGTFYNYFKSKDELIFQIMKGDWTLLLAQLKAKSTSPGNQYNNIRALYEGLAEFERTYRLMAFGPAIKKKHILQYERDEIGKLYDLITLKIKEEIEAGAVDPKTKPEKRAYLIVQLCMAAGRNPEITFDDLWEFLQE